MKTGQQILSSIGAIKRRNEEGAKKYKRRMLDTLQDNLLTKKQKVEDNAGLILRIQGVQPRGLTQMQQAMLDAAQREVTSEFAPMERA